MALFTVGYENRSIIDFLDLLHDQGTQLLVDLRSSPRSPRDANYNQVGLQRALRMMSIGYQWQGALLGGRPERPDLYTPEGYADYAACRADSLVRGALRGLQDLDRQGMVLALMCSEAKPEQCHRSRMVAQGLVEMGSGVGHVDETGQMIQHQDVLDRLSGGQEVLFGGLDLPALQRSDHRLAGRMLDGDLLS